MATFQIDVTDKHAAALATVVARYNANTGQAFTVLDWLNLHVREIAVQDELALETAALAKQAEEGLQAAIASLRTRMLEGERA